jgi:hypothetical protein
MLHILHYLMIASPRNLSNKKTKIETMSLLAKRLGFESVYAALLQPSIWQPVATIVSQIPDKPVHWED